MSQDLITRYKKSFRARFHNEETEARYRDLQEIRGRSSSAFAFAALAMLCFAFAYLEFRAFGHDVAIPMYGYLLAGVAAVGNFCVSRFAADTLRHNLRLFGNGVFAMGTVIGAVFLQKYSAYHAIEFILLVTWLGSLKTLRMLYTFGINAA